MTILVTGGTGLVGPRLLRRLTTAGVSCRVLVRTNSGRDLPDGVDRVEGDLADAASLERAVAGVDAVVHFAALFRTGDEQAIWQVNHVGTQHLIGAVQQHAPTARLIMASTANVYAANLDRPASENAPTTTENAYAASKLAAEAELRNSGLTWAVLRFPFIYGDGDGHLEGAPQRLAQMGRHPAQRLSVLHHEDLASAVQLALTGAMDGQAVNIAADASVSVYEMAQIAGADYQPSGAPLDNPWEGQVDTTLARQLGYNARILTVQQAAREQRL